MEQPLQMFCGVLRDNRNTSYSALRACFEQARRILAIVEAYGTPQERGEVNKILAEFDLLGWYLQDPQEREAVRREAMEGNPAAGFVRGSHAALERIKKAAADLPK